MVQHAEEYDYVKLSNPIGREFVNVEHSVFNSGLKQAVRDVKIIIFDTVDCNNLRAPALHFKTTPARRGSDIQHALSAQIRRYCKRIHAGAQSIYGNDSRDDISVR